MSLEYRFRAPSFGGPWRLSNMKMRGDGVPLAVWVDDVAGTRCVLAGVVVDPALRANGAQKPLQNAPYQTDTRQAVRVEANSHGENPVLTAPDKR